MGQTLPIDIRVSSDGMGNIFSLNDEQITMTGRMVDNSIISGEVTRDGVGGGRFRIQEIVRFLLLRLTLLALYFPCAN